MWRNAHILLDPTGAIQARQQIAHDFEWEQLQPVANWGASYALYRKAEEIITFLGTLERQELWGAEILRGFLFNWLGTAVAMRYGILIRSEKTLFPEIMAYLGHSSPWSQSAQEAVEIRPRRSPAVVQLYRETV